MSVTILTLLAVCLCKEFSLNISVKSYAVWLTFVEDHMLVISFISQLTFVVQPSELIYVVNIMNILAWLAFNTSVAEPDEMKRNC